MLIADKEIIAKSLFRASKCAKRSFLKDERRITSLQTMYADMLSIIEN